MMAWSFWSLLAKYSVCIPKIQRDYAQGRGGAKNEQIREVFVADLSDALLDEKKILNLDFIYGSVVDGRLVLLDGQQRITTLFLLHWFVAWQSQGLNKDEQAMLLRFTYETRLSSKEFCRDLVSHAIDLDKIPGDNVSSKIKNAPWFHWVWNDDPTIQSMLTMLNTIERYLQGKICIKHWNRLVYSGSSPIQFHVLDMDEYRLTDELYLKMNSRGKSLSEFENFKAWLLGYCEKQEYHMNAAEWTSKVDGAWSDLFWKIRVKGEFEVDSPLLMYFKGMALFETSRTASNPLAFVKRMHENDFILFHEYEAMNCFSEDSLRGMFHILDVLCLAPAEPYLELLKSTLPAKNYESRLQFLALTEFFAVQVKKTELVWNSSLLDQWMRMTSNLIKNSKLETDEEFVPAVRTLRMFSRAVLGNVTNDQEFCKVVTEYNPDLLTGFRKDQRQEEILKCKLILEAGWEAPIRVCEDHPYFYGQIGFLLDFSKNPEGDYDLELFKRISRTAMQVFTPEILGRSDHLLKRALLTKGCYLVWVGGNNLSFCTSDMGTLRSREENWRKVFRDPVRSRYLKELLENLSDSENIPKSMEEMVAQFSGSTEWHTRFISSPQAIEACGYRQIRVENEGKMVYLLSKSRMSGAYAELRTYCVWKDLFALPKPVFDIYPFMKSGYHWVSGRNERPCLYLNGWMVDDLHLTLDVHFDGSEFEFTLFERGGRPFPSKVMEMLYGNSYMYENDRMAQTRHTIKNASFGDGYSKFRQMIGQDQP